VRTLRAVLTRRKAIVVGGSVLLVAGCGGRSARLLAGSPADLQPLAAALELERTQIVLYERGVRLLRGTQATLAREVLGQEREHAEAIAEAIRELGGKPAPPQAADVYARRVPAGGGPGAWIRSAIAYEQQVAAAYAAAIPKLANPRLRGTFGAILTTEVEHAAALDVSR
jgi:rubrerythrin